MQCPRCRHENRSGAKFCEDCATPLARRCRNCGGVIGPSAKFCSECAHPVSVPDSPSRFGVPSAYTPKHLAERILTSRAAIEGERKQVTVLFADLKGSMEMLADRDPEEARRILDPVLEHMIEAVHRFEGTVNQVMGDGIMALFGAPLAHEDHAVRACYAALRMQDAVKRYAEGVRRDQGLTIRIRVGLNSGEVVVRAIGSDLRMDYTAVGQTTHLAARMEQLADPATVLMTATTLTLAEDFVQARTLGPTPVKGLGGPVEVFELTGATAVRSRFKAHAARGLTKFVGRASEITQLTETLQLVRSGRGQVVAVVGEPGVGKSRLFWEFMHSHRIEGCLALESASVSYGRATTYLPVIELLRAYFDIEPRDDTRKIREKVTGKLLSLDRALDSVAPAVFSLLDLPAFDDDWARLDPTERRQRTLDAVKRLLLRESRVQPLIVSFEDLHWIDGETQSVLDALVESVPTARVLLLVNFRPEYRHDWGGKTYYRQVRIDALPPASAEELLRSVVGPDPTLDGLARLLVERTEGNPFFLEESVRTLVETGVLVGVAGAYRLTRPPETLQIPATAQAIVAARVDRLDADDKRLLQAAAVIGKDVPLLVLEAIADLREDDLRQRLARLQAAEFLYETRLFPDVEYTFKHALTHEVTYGGLLHDRRKMLHARVVRAIGEVYGSRLAEHIEALARHALRGELWEEAVDFLRSAAAKAHARSAFRDALDQLEAALDVVPRLAPTAENLRRAIDVRLDFHLPLFVLVQVPRLIELHGEAEALARQLDDPRRLGRVSYRMGVYSWIRAEYARTIDYAREALCLPVAAEDPELRIPATYILAVAHHARGEYREAIGLLTGYLEGPDAETAKRRLGLASGSPYVLGCHRLVRCASALGDFDRALRYADYGVHTAEAADDPPGQAWAYTGKSFALMAKGEFAAALSWVERAVHICETKRVLLCLPEAYVNAGRALSQLRRADEALAYLERGVSAAEGVSANFCSAWSYLAWAEGLLLAGRIDDAAAKATLALQRAEAAGERGNEAAILRLLGEIEASKDSRQWEPAVVLYRRANERAAALGMRPLVARGHAGLAALYGRAGKLIEADEHRRSAEAMYAEMDMTF